MTEKQKFWLLKIRKDIHDEFPIECMDDEKFKELMKKINHYEEIANHNPDVCRWLIQIADEYEDLWKILSGSGQTLRERYKEISGELKRTKEVLNEISNLCEHSGG